ncbi:SIS domain-containing protein [Fusobacterium mortiferum]|uniref:SIS domain-containing protein n=1 Tax=Fusobacterium mortiferum TaxID=850 RepID=UPI00158BC033|nr:SIS domain-containing protein [Fusobacterium mortiferum]
MKKHVEYFNYIQKLLEEVLKEENTNLEKAISLIVQKIKDRKSIFIFGASHAGILSEEVFYRAGGLAIINPILESSIMLNTRPVTFTSVMERLSGYGTEIAKKTKINKGDLIICHSVSGRNPVILDFVNEAKEKGAIILAITNVKYSKTVTARTSTGNKRLFELADIVIDNHGEIGDASISYEGLEQKVAPSSTVIGATIVNSIICGVVEELLRLGITPPIFYSANLDGGDEKNSKIFEEYKDNIFYM